MNQQEEMKNFKPFSYEVQSFDLIGSFNHCQAISINKQNKFIIVASQSEIKVFLFKKGDVKQLASIKKHKQHVSTLNFFNFNSNFVSGSKSLIIWPLVLISTQKYLYKLSGHTKQIMSLELHPQEQLIISVSLDTTIRFWFNNQLEVYNQTINEHKDQVFGLAINKEGNKLISCGKDKLILVIEQGKNKFTSWSVRQIIYLNQFGYRISFINNSSFAFQPLSENKGYINGTDFLHIYTSDHLGFYNKQKELPVAGGGQPCCIYFPPIYNQNKDILFVKNGYMVSLLRTDEQYQNQKQYIFFDCTQFYQGRIIGTMSEDGEYLFIWDAQSGNIQLRKYVEKI